ALVTIVIATSSPVLARVVTDTLIKLTMVVGLYIFVGNSGILSFCQGAFMVIGAYASAWLTMPVTMKQVILPELPSVLQLASFDPLIGGAAAVALVIVIAFLIGVPLMRLSGIAASIATFALLTAVVVVYNHWTSWTKGAASIVGLPLYV